MLGAYVLDEAGEPVPESNLFKAEALLCNISRRRVAYTGGLPGGARVSTVFLVYDHNPADEGPPVLWETCVFGGPLDGEIDRYSTRAEAVAGHERMCARVAEAEA